MANPRPFFEATARFRARHVALYDFMHGAAAAIWNTRWQVHGYLETVGEVSKTDLDNRFVHGSGIRGANIRRTFFEQTWDEQREELARIALVNTAALYEGWVATVTHAFPSGSSAKELQFPSKGVQGRTARGVGDALKTMTNSKSLTMTKDITPLLRGTRLDRAKELDDLLLIYRYFKEARNAVVHYGGLPTDTLIEAHAGLAAVTPRSAGLAELPEHFPPVASQPLKLSLRGVIGFGAVVFYIVATIDAELSQTKVAEEELVRRFGEKYGTIDVPAEQPARHKRVRWLIHNLGVPRPTSVQKIDDLLVSQGLIK